jgi:hypothetical protein
MISKPPQTCIFHPPRATLVLKVGASTVISLVIEVMGHVVLSDQMNVYIEEKVLIPYQRSDHPECLH